MKKLLLFISVLFLCLTAYNQNAPIAVNDTIYISANDTMYYTQLTGLIYTGNIGLYNPDGTFTSISGNFNAVSNDIEIDGDTMYIDSAFYNGMGSFSSSIFINGILHRINIRYTPPLNFTGIDSIMYILHDDEIPARYDTATIYIVVKHRNFEQLDLNNISARLDFYSLFHDDNNAIADFSVPKRNNSNDPKYTTIFAANLWLAGKSQDSVFMNTETFGISWNNFNPITEFKAPSGPIMDSAHYSTNYNAKWDRLWKINNADLVYHQNNWNVNGYQPIEVIANWPAHGDTTKGQAFYLAPFVDNNNDGVYNPLDGDYPKIKGQQAIYYIYNDIRWQANTQKPMQSEVHYMAYAYHCPSDSALYNTMFIDYTIYNRSNLTYDSTYVGMWTDFDIGNSSDDYVACDVERSTFYGYNGDAVDESANGISGYDIYPPAQGVVFLQGAKKDADGVDNPFTSIIQDVIDSNGTPYAGLGTGFGDGITDNEHWGMEHFMYYSVGFGVFPGDGGPQTQVNYYNYLRGYWRDGSQLVWGGNGNAASTGGTIPAKHLYPGNSDPLWYGTGGVATTPVNWSEATTGNVPGDRRGMGSTGPFTFEPDSSIEITLAFVFGRDYQTTGAQAGVVVMQERIDSIRHYFNTDFVSACNGVAPVSVKENSSKSNDLKVYPNPFTNELTVNYKLKNSQATLSIYNLIGENIYATLLNKNSTRIALSNFDKGIYFIKIIDGDKSITQKVVKQ